MIRFGNDYAIDSDDCQWRVCRIYTNKKGEETVQAKSYHTTFHSAVQALFSLKIRKSEYNSMAQLAKNIDEIKREIMSVIEARASDNLDL